MELSQEIEQLREKLVELAILKGINDPEVIKLSQELDELIVEYQKRK